VHGVTSNIIKEDDTGKPVVELMQPLDGWVYINDNQRNSVIYGKTKIIGPLTVITEAEDIEKEGEIVSGVNRVEFYIDNELKSLVNEEPHIWEMQRTERTFGQHEIRVIAYDNAGNPSESKHVEVFVLF
jgi:hypothetical protein